MTAGPSPGSLMVVETVASSSAYVVSKVVAQVDALQSEKELSFRLKQTHRSRAAVQVGGLQPDLRRTPKKEMPIDSHLTYIADVCICLARANSFFGTYQ